ncbi:RnfH family protein [Dyella ginsengisoli]|uniref:RnfH family protein n=1 Tax=Dyella ginsengisoli TaxID=363848 RepID=UPI00034B875B|nr:RnfH family protein [Dyella ginsengisoli]
MADRAGLIQVDVVVAMPGAAWSTSVELPLGATVADAAAAIERTGCPQTAAEAIRAKRLGVFGRRVDEKFVLGDGDRLELYRPLTADPKEARRRRAARPG